MICSLRHWMKVRWYNPTHCSAVAQKTWKLFGTQKYSPEEMPYCRGRAATKSKASHSKIRTAKQRRKIVNPKTRSSRSSLYFPTYTSQILQTSMQKDCTFIVTRAENLPVAGLLAECVPPALAVHHEAPLGCQCSDCQQKAGS